MNRSDGPVRVEETEQIEELKDGGALEVQRTRRLADANGNFITAEVRRSVERKAANGTLTSEHTVSRQDRGKVPGEGGISPVQKTVTREWKDSSGEAHSFVQTYSTEITGVAPNGELQLEGQVSTRRRVMSDGSTQQMEHVDKVTAGAPYDGLRPNAEIVEITRSGPSGQFHAERTVKASTPDGKMEPVSVTKTHGSETRASDKTR